MMGDFKGGFVNPEFASKSIVIFDLDHTLRDASRRDHLLETCYQTNSWDAYHDDGYNDPDCPDLRRMFTTFKAAGFICMGLTAVPDKHRAITERWLTEWHFPLQELLMEARDGRVPTFTLKHRILVNRFGENFADYILFIVDDHNDVSESFPKLGITTLQVRNRTYSEAEREFHRLQFRRREVMKDCVHGAGICPFPSICQKENHCDASFNGYR